MYLSNRLTFSLIFSVLLLAFVTLPVMAHEGTAGNLTHDHPLTETLPVIDVDGDDSLGEADVPGEAEVTPHNAHPNPVITLKSGQDNVRGNMIALDATTNTTFTLVVDYGMDVTSSASSTDTTGVADADLTIGSSAYTTLQVDNTAATGATLAITRVADDASMFEVVVTPGLYPNADTAAEATNDDTLMFRIQLPAGGLFSLQTLEDVGTVNLLPVPGGASLESALYVFTLVAELPPAETPPDTTAPTLTITHAPDDGTELTADQKVTFTFTFNEALGSNADAFTSGDIGVTNAADTDFGGSGLVYTLVVTPEDPALPITVTVAQDAVQNLVDLALAEDGSETFYPADETHPTVTITATESQEDVDSDGVMEIVITFKFDFSEEISDTHKDGFTRSDLDNTESNFGIVLGEGEPVQDPNDPTIYTFKVVAASVGPTTISLQAGSVADTSGNPLLNDQPGQYIPETMKPAITITGPTLLAQRKYVGNNITVRVRDDLGITGGLAGDEVVITNGEKTGFAYANNQATFTVKPNVGAVRVKVTVKADSITDSVGNGNAEKSEWFNVGPIFEIKAKAHLVVVKDFNRQQTFAFLSDDTYPTEGEINPVRPAILSARQILISNWTEMPDLERMFNITTGEGGGALVLKKAASQETLAKGAVGITEIMWASDLNRIGQVQDAEARYQWIELENLTNETVNVHLFHRVGQETNDIETDEIDRAGNFYDKDRYTNRWDVGTKGQNGNSWTGVDFISMHRKTPASDKNYSHVNGMDDEQWEKSSLIFLTKIAGNRSKEYWHRGTPGRRHIPGTDPETISAGRRAIPTDNVTINEVGNNSNDDYDWIELKGAAGKDLRNYMISIVTSNSSDVPLIQFPADDKAKIADNGVFLILASDPANDPNHPIAIGFNVTKGAEEQAPGQKTSPVRYRVIDFALPSDGKFVLLLRTPDTGDGERSGANNDKGVAETGNADLNRIVDIAGWDDDLAKSKYPDDISSTKLWPLHNFENPFTDRNAFKNNTVHRRQHVSTNDGRSGVGAVENKNEDGKAAFRDVGWTGVGYRRSVNPEAKHGGTPGYPNGALHGAGTTITDAVYISEIMYADSSTGTLPQWIEIRNTSKTEGANLHNWRLTITNHDQIDDAEGLWDGKGEASVLLRNLKIKPNSAVLISSRRAARSDVYLADDDIFILYPAHRNTFGMTSLNDDVINPYGFKITLHANGHEGDRNKWQLVDEASNLADVQTDRRGNRQRFDAPRWAWPNAMTEDHERMSVTRKDEGLLDGTKAYGWMLTDIGRTSFTYYGHRDDISSPGQTVGSPLPVNLSFFRPTLEDDEVVIRWTTESELDNAGFNIYRSDARDGEFKKVNAELIQGNGTTGERSTYKWVDESAKPGAVYYYQIEDVSFAGERQTLATTKLKGLISAKNKATTIWGEIKEVQ